jgi:hypothetical protein
LEESLYGWSAHLKASIYQGQKPNTHINADNIQTQRDIRTHDPLVLCVWDRDATLIGEVLLHMNAYTVTFISEIYTKFNKSQYALSSSAI